MSRDYDHHWTVVRTGVAGAADRRRGRKVYRAVCTTCSWENPQIRTTVAAAERDCDEHVIAVAR